MGRNTGKGEKPAAPAPDFPFPPDQLLVKGLSALGFAAGEATPARGADTVPGAVTVRGISTLVPLVERYLKELELFNAVFDLVGAGTRSDLVVRHILDSLAPWKEIASLIAGNEAYKIADAGSGAGFPGIPLAIAFPGIHFTLIERMSKRCTFLENCTAVMGLKNVTVLNSEVEKAPASAFDVVVFRAFRPLDREMVHTLLALTVPGGKLAAYKAKKDKITDEMGAIADEVDGWDVLPLTVPFLGHEERHLVVTSSAKFPYRAN